MKNYDIIIFDIDRTLLDFDKSEEVALKKTLEHYNVSYSPEALQFYRKLNDQLWKDFEENKISQNEIHFERFDKLCNELGFQCDNDEINSKYIHHLSLGAYPFENSLTVCETLHRSGKQLYIASNGNPDVQYPRIESSGLGKFVKDIFVSEEIGFSKPSADFFDHVVAKINQPRNNMLMVGDSLSADIAGANNAGIDSCWYNPNNHKNNTGILPSYEIQSLMELI